MTTGGSRLKLLRDIVTFRMFILITIPLILINLYSPCTHTGFSSAGCGWSSGGGQVNPAAVSAGRAAASRRECGGLGASVLRQPGGLGLLGYSEGQHSLWTALRATLVQLCRGCLCTGHGE